MSKIRDYFTFTRSERNGILVLLFIIMILLISLKIIPIFFNRTQVDYSSFEKEVNQFISSVEKQDKESQSTILGNNKDIIFAVEYFNFDPNSVSEIEMQKLGIPKKVIKIWLKYRLKGGRFRMNEDIKKIWGLNDSVYHKLLPYIEIAKTENKQKYEKEYSKNRKINYQNQNDVKKRNYTSSFSDKKDNSVELNIADSVSLCALPGIGPGFAKRILKYRDLLGGFVVKEQLLEIFGFSMDLFSKIENLVYIETSSVKKINLNKAEFKQLIRHPYSTKESVNKILEYRRIQGKISNLQDLVKDKMLTQEQCAKLMPYVEY